MTGTELRTTTETAADLLRACGARIDPVLRAAVDTLPSSTRHIAGYHLGWWDRHGADSAEVTGGKAVRPALVLRAAQATQPTVDGEPALPAAAAVELVHNSSLLHDDVIDNDHTRRHRPTAWSVFGAGNAILAGDALLALAFDLVDGPARRILNQAVQRLLEGQCMDLALEAGSDVDVISCEAMALAKTGRLIGCACALGCVCAGGGDEQVAYFTAFGERLGLAFQHVDDLLGIWGDPAITGKPVYSDLRNRKKSLPVVHALTSGTSAGQELAARYGTEPGPDYDFAHEATLVEDAGGREWSTQRADNLLAEALRQLRLAVPEYTSATELTALAERIVRRDR